MSATIGSARKKFKELPGLLDGKQGSSLKQRGKISFDVLLQNVGIYC